MGLGQWIASKDVLGKREQFIEATVTDASQSLDLAAGPFKEIEDAKEGEKHTTVLERFRDSFREAALKAAELQNPAAEKIFNKVSSLAQEAIDQINQPEVNIAELNRIRFELAKAIGICLMWKSPSSLVSMAQKW